MTKEQVMETLKSCGQGINPSACANCPYHDFPGLDCINAVMLDAWNLIDGGTVDVLGEEEQA